MAIMKIKNQLHIISFLFLGFNILVANSTDNNHSISAKFGTGAVITNDSTLDTKLSEQYGLVYNYRLNKNYAVSTQYLEGRFTCFIACFTSDFRSAEWRSQQITLKKLIPFTMRWSAFAKLGINYSRNRFTTNNVSLSYITDEMLPDTKSSGVNYVLALGLEFKTSNGFKFGFDAQHLPMPLFDANIYSAFVGYSF